MEIKQAVLFNAQLIPMNNIILVTCIFNGPDNQAGRDNRGSTVMMYHCMERGIVT